MKKYYYVASLDEMLGRLLRGDLRDGTIGVTFDDGYADTLAVAYPIAKEFGISLTVFVTVEPIVTGLPFWWDELAHRVLKNPTTELVSTRAADQRGAVTGTSDAERRTTYTRLHSFLKDMPGTHRQAALAQIGSRAKQGELCGRPLTVGELQKLARLPGISIGAHTMSHPRLGALSVKEQARELTASKKALAELTSQPITLVAYPFGKSTDFSRTTSRLATCVGYHAGFTTIPKPLLASDCRYALPRLTVHDWREDTFAARLSVLFSGHR